MAPATGAGALYGGQGTPGADHARRPPRGQGDRLEAGLRYVYVGNVPGEANTFCHSCGRLLIRRSGYWILENYVCDGRCPYCGTPVAGVGMG